MQQYWPFFLPLRGAAHNQIPHHKNLSAVLIGIYHDLKIKGAASDIIQAITLPEAINGWWTKKCTGRLGLGESYNFYFSEDYDWYATVVEYIPEKKVAFDMTICSPDWMGTRFSFEILEELPQGRLVRFEHVGWRAVTDHFRVSSYCWVSYLNNLKRLVEQGERTSYQEK